MAERAKHPLVLIMAGGSGTRFWPLSTPDCPKQFLKLVDNQSLLQATVERTLQWVPVEKIVICGLKRHEELLRSQLPEVSHFIFEPTGKNTAPCILLSVLSLIKAGHSPNEVVVVLPADHHVGQPQKLIQVLEKAVAFAQESEGLVTLGIQPTSPHTGYGYIEKGGAAETAGVFEVKRFLEKPAQEKAKDLLEQGNCYWNSGMFIWTLGAIAKAFEHFMPGTTKRLKECKSQNELSVAYETLSADPIDKAVMEKAKNVYVIPADVAWSDLGSWDAIFQLFRSSSDKNVVLGGQTQSVDSEGCLVHAPPHVQVGLIGVKDLAIVIQDGKILITDRSQDQKVKKLLEKFT